MQKKMQTNGTVSAAGSVVLRGVLVTLPYPRVRKKRLCTKRITEMDGQYPPTEC